MTKSVLIIDTPDNCNECPLMSTDYARGFQEVCNASAKNFRGEAWKIKDIFDVRPSWCPLKSLPKKRDEHVLCGGSWDLEHIIDSENRGWNACIDYLEEE